MASLSKRKRACVLFLLCCASAVALQAQTFTSLLDFDGTDGAAPNAYLVQGPDGDYYGTTADGGANCFLNCGTVFKVNARGTLTTLYSFCSQTTCADGADPAAGLVLATDGNFYGTTYFGGVGGKPCNTTIYGCGTIFRVTPAGKLTTLYRFSGLRPSGTEPTATLVQGIDGNLYGTAGGGANDGGMVFELTRSGLTTLYSFCAEPECADGKNPSSGLTLGIDGNFYGTTVWGGNTSCNVSVGCGTVFRITPSGALTTLYAFCSQMGCTDGVSPMGALIQASDGYLYGSTSFGGHGSGPCGAGGCGTLFRMTTTGGQITTLHTFCSASHCSDGFYPSDGLLQSTNGVLYGVASNASGDGTVFSLSMGLDPFVAFVRNPARIGQKFGILGQGLTGTTNVSLNGVPASFIVKSDTLIEATVPRGATTGYVTVTTPSGTLTSNVPFHVIP